MQNVSRTIEVSCGILIAGKVINKIKFLKFDFEDHPTIQISYEVLKTSLLGRTILVKLTFVDGGDIDAGIQSIRRYLED